MADSSYQNIEDFGDFGLKLAAYASDYTIIMYLLRMKLINSCNYICSCTSVGLNQRITVVNLF